MKGLERRVKQLERKLAPESKAPPGGYSVHLHEGPAIDNPREHCPRCCAMTDEEYAEWCKPRKDGRIHWIQVIEVKGTLE